jgi:hypothetical protein
MSKFRKIWKYLELEEDNILSSSWFNNVEIQQDLEICRAHEENDIFISSWFNK